MQVLSTEREQALTLLVGGEKAKTLNVIGFQPKVLAPLKIQERILTNVDKLTKVLRPEQTRESIESNKPTTRVVQNKPITRVVQSKPLTRTIQNKPFTKLIQNNQPLTRVILNAKPVIPTTNVLRCLQKSESLALQVFD